MPHVAHFSINADNLDRARKFYGNAFGWKFDPWGPPGFYMINTGDAAAGEMLGSLQGRRELIPGQRMIGYECTISVPSISDAIQAIEQNGGKLVMQKTVITGVGSLVFFEDTEGNVAGAMQYEKPAK
jgi:predicted enzyme related to lactoylglutathione lyase